MSLVLSHPVECLNTFERDITVLSDGKRVGALRVSEELIEESSPSEGGIRTWEGVMKPARKKGDKQMWRLMESPNPDVLQRVWMRELELQIKAQYGQDAWDGPPTKPSPISPSIRNGKVVEYKAVWDKSREEWCWKEVE